MGAPNLPQPVAPVPPPGRDDVPLYTESDEGMQSMIQQLSTSSGRLNLPITSFPGPEGYGLTPPDEPTRLQQDIVRSFFEAVSTKKDEVVAMMIENNLVTANTTDWHGETPLLAAVAAGNVRMVQELVDFGAEVDALGVHQTKERTPLQLAASMGNLTLVKLFIDVYHADDAIVAPDGQLALRLASENGHREVTDYLPLRRGGGWRRWKTHHAKAMERSKRALKRIYRFFEFFVWDVPKFFLWTIPKELIFKPAKEGLVWTWKNRGHFGPWCKKQAQEMPGRFQRASHWVWERTKAIPKAIGKAAKETWKFSTQTLPRWLKKFCQYLVSLVTKRIPAALKAIAQWLWLGLKSISHSISSVLGRTLSLLHSVVSAIVSFFRAVTLKDIWNGFCDLLRSIFVDLPVKLGGWILVFWETSYQVMKSLFGVVGQILWFIGFGLVWIAMYVPEKIFLVLTSLGGSVGKAWQELLVWINPKR